MDELPAMRGLRVLVRASLNVPLERGVVRDDFRLKAACETLGFLREQGARVVVLAHIGRDSRSSLRPVSERLREFLPHTFVDALTGPRVAAALSALQDGEVLLLENVRSDPREEANDEAFARNLASYADIYVNDALADSHRVYASIVGIPKFLPSYAGFSFARAYETLSRALAPQQPALCIIGGAKAETKLPLLERLAEIYDHVFVVGALANDFFKAKGYETGKSLVSDITLADSPLLVHPRLGLPEDVVVDGPRGRAEKAAHAVSEDETICDIGPQTLARIAPLIAEAKTILWNGPLGNYEKGYDEATSALARMIASASRRSSAESIIGGGDTLAAIERLGLRERFSFVSTAGGAMLQFLTQGTLPGIEALARSSDSTE